MVYSRVPCTERKCVHAPPQEPTVGLCLESWGTPRGEGVFLWARYPCTAGHEGGGVGRLMYSRLLCKGTCVQGYLTHKKMPTPLGPP